MKQISWTTIDDQLWKIKLYVAKHTVSELETRKTLDPLVWYINTGRASVPFLHWFLEAKPYVVGRILLNTPGSTEDVVKALKAKAE